MSIWFCCFSKQTCLREKKSQEDYYFDNWLQYYSSRSNSCDQKLMENFIES